MSRDEYQYHVARILESHTELSASRLAKALELIPPFAKEVTIDIFVDQDGEGFLDVQVGLEGPDLYVLNRAIQPHSEIFTTRMTENGLEPPLPLMDAFGEEFSVSDTLTDCAAKWIASMWKHVNASNIRIPVIVQSPEGYGTVPPFKLN